MCLASEFKVIRQLNEFLQLYEMAQMNCFSLLLMHDKMHAVRSELNEKNAKDRSCLQCCVKNSKRRDYLSTRII